MMAAADPRANLGGGGVDEKGGPVAAGREGGGGVVVPVREPGFEGKDDAATDSPVRFVNALLKGGLRWQGSRPRVGDGNGVVNR